MIRLGQDWFYFQILYKVEFLVHVSLDFFDPNYEQKWTRAAKTLKMFFPIFPISGHYEF